jgi:inner membrane protein yagU
MQILIINIHQSKKECYAPYFLKGVIMNSQTKERFGLVALLCIPISIMSAFVKWGGEFPLLSRNPKDMFDAACGPESLIGAADQTKLLV